MNSFKSRVFCYAKDPENAQQNQDAFQISEAQGTAVVADGVSSAIFSAAWADILTRHIVTERPDPTNLPVFTQWLAGLRTEWEQRIDTTNLAWFQRPKLAAGAFSTLIWVTIREIVPPKPGTPNWESLMNPDSGRKCYHVKGYCIGDSCLFHVRPGRTDSKAFPETDLYRAIPLTDSHSFDLPPIVIGSKDLGHDAQMKFKPIDFLAQEGDLILMATDAVSQWILRCYETQNYPCWDVFWNLPQEEWEHELDALRAAGEIRYDDSTLVLLQAGTASHFLNEIPPAAEQAAPVVLDEFLTLEEPEPELKPEPAPQPEPELQLEPGPDLQLELEPETRPEFKPAEPVPAPTPKPVPTPKPAFTPATPKPAAPTPQPVPQPIPKPIPRPVRKPAAPAKPAPSAPIEGLSDPDSDAKLAESWHQIREGSSQIAGILGEQLSEGMSRLGSNVNRMGSQFNESVSHLGEAAKPKLQTMAQRFAGLFRRKDADQENAEESPKEENTDAPRRVVDPNRRRYYNPPPRE